LALPPEETGESFVREVDENLRRDQMAEMAKQHGKWIIAAVIVFLVAIGGYLFWQNRQQAQAAADSEAMTAALDKVAAADVKGGQAAVQPLTDSSNDITRATAQLTNAALALRQNDRATAAAIYKRVAADDGLPGAYRDLATVRAVSVEYDTLKPDEVISRLSSLSQPGNPFFGTAGELTAMAMLAKGNRAGAGQLFAKIAADKQVPETIRSRAVQVAGSLGVDATASMPGDPAAAPAN